MADEKSLLALNGLLIKVERISLPVGKQLWNKNYNENKVFSSLILDSLNKLYFNTNVIIINGSLNAISFLWSLSWV